MKDLTDGVRIVTVEPIQIKKADENETWGTVYVLAPKSMTYFETPCPDDEYTRILEKFMVYKAHYHGTLGWSGPSLAGIYFFFDQENVERIYLAEYWFYISKSVIPVKSYSLSLIYPAGFGMYVYNPANKNVDVFVGMTVIKKLKMEV